MKGNSWRNWSWLKWKVPQASSMGLAAARLQLVFPQEDFKELGKKNLAVQVRQERKSQPRGRESKIQESPANSFSEICNSP